MTPLKICILGLTLAGSFPVLGCRTAVSPDRTAALAGTWYGPMPPTRDGTVLNDVPVEEPYIFWVLVEVAPPDATGTVSGTISFCENGKAMGNMQFAKARLGGTPVPLTDGSGKPAQSLGFFEMTQSGTTVRAVLSGGEQGEAGYLKKTSRAAFDQRCHAG